jgi:hypothetical protein
VAPAARFSASATSIKSPHENLALSLMLRQVA